MLFVFKMYNQVGIMKYTSFSIKIAVKIENIIWWFQLEVHKIEDFALQIWFKFLKTVKCYKVKNIFGSCSIVY